MEGNTEQLHKPKLCCGVQRLVHICLLSLYLVDIIVSNVIGVPRHVPIHLLVHVVDK